MLGMRLTMSSKILGISWMGGRLFVVSERAVFLDASPVALLPVARSPFFLVAATGEEGSSTSMSLPASDAEWSDLGSLEVKKDVMDFWPFGPFLLPPAMKKAGRENV